jgi:hypothetical protein
MEHVMESAADGAQDQLSLSIQQVAARKAAHSVLRPRAAQVLPSANRRLSTTGRDVGSGNTEPGQLSFRF